MTQPRPRKSTRKLFAVCALALVTLGVAASGVWARRSPFQPLTVFARALAHIETSYVEPVSQDELVRGAVRGMLESLDPHSAFLDPAEYEMLEADAEGRFAGVGVEVSMQDGWLTILSVFDGGPAARAGLQPGDRFLAIDGAEARDIRLYDAVARMRGEPGTQVRVSIRRPGVEQALERTLTRAYVQVEPVELRYLEAGIIYVRIETFSETTTRALREALDSAAARLRAAGGVSGLLLDLRDNAGGLLQQAIAVSDEFLASGSIVSTRDRTGQEIREYRARRSGTRPKWPLVVLINEYTASAAEIVAGALQDHQRAVLVGERTFGKGSVQSIFELPDGSAVKLTVAKYYTPSGRSIQATGIVPDYRAVMSESRPAGLTPMREEELERHLPATAEPASGTGSTRRPPDAPPVSKPSPALGDDVQAQHGYELLRRLTEDKRSKD